MLYSGRRRVRLELRGLPFGATRSHGSHIACVPLFEYLQCANGIDK